MIDHRAWIRTDIEATERNERRTNTFLKQMYKDKYLLSQYWSDRQLWIVVYTDAHDWAAFILKHGDKWDKFKYNSVDLGNWLVGIPLGELSVISSGANCGKSKFAQLYLNNWPNNH